MTFGTKVVCLGQEVVCAVNSSSFFLWEGSIIL